MAFKKVMMGLQCVSSSTLSLDEQIFHDKKDGNGVQGDLLGSKYYIPADAKLGGL